MGTTAPIVDIPQLEKTILQMAQDCLTVAEQYRDKRLQGTVTDEDAETFMDSTVALETLVKLAYNNASGMTQETPSVTGWHGKSGDTATTPLAAGLNPPHHPIFWSWTMAQLKVFCCTLGGRDEGMIAATSRKAAAQAFGMSLYELTTYGIDANDEEAALALAGPGAVFKRNDQVDREWRLWKAAPSAPTVKAK